MPDRVISEAVSGIIEMAGRYNWNLKHTIREIKPILPTLGLVAAGVAVPASLAWISGKIIEKKREKENKKKDRISAGEFMGKTSSEAKEHQKRVVRKLKDKDALLIYHGMGSGKTLTSILAGKDQDLDTIVIGPASLRHNYPKEMAKHNIEGNVNYYTYHKTPDDPETTKDKLLVFDEAHQMGRMQSARSKYPDIYKGKKTLLMTGTPIRNAPAELIPLFRGLGLNVPRDESGFNQLFIENIKKYPNLLARMRGVTPGIERRGKNLDIIRKALTGMVDYHVEKGKDFPDVEEENFDVEMSKRQYKTYREMMKGYPGLVYKIKHGLPPDKQESKRLNAFLSAVRQISNTPRPFNLSTQREDEPKIDKVVSEILKHRAVDKNYRGVTYSNYLAAGVNPIAERLEELGVPHVKFTGQLTPKEKREAISRYNKGDIVQLLISGAGAEGIDLRGTKLMQVLEPHWNEPRIEQVKARAIRIKSHAHLPPDERRVKVQTFMARPRKGGFIFKNQPMGADAYLSMLSAKRQKLNDDFLEILRRAANE